ncbi:MAG TPA: DUF2795 domain-containing protein [Aggregicoccus sp.]|nr:DUF2795 domain-containing protein [Aggregicoccus sp.]
MSPEPERPHSDQHPSRSSSTDSLARDVSGALAGAVFPLSPEQLLRVARENEAPGPLLTLLSALPSRRFDSLEAVAHTLDDAHGEDPTQR